MDDPNACMNLAYMDDLQCAFGILRFCLGAHKMSHSFSCYYLLDKSKKIQRKNRYGSACNLWKNLGVLMSDISWDQACLPINKTRVEIRRSANKVQATYVRSVFLSSVHLEKPTGHNPTGESSFVEAIEDVGKIATHPSQ